MLSKMRFETKNFFDLMLVHGDKADAIHQAHSPAPEIQPEFIRPLMEILIHPQNLQYAQNIPGPEACGIEPDPFMKQSERLPHHVVGCD